MPATIALRNIKAYIPEYPVGTAAECADMIHEFVPIACRRRTFRSEDHQLRTETFELPCLQRPDQAALQPRRRDRRELRAGSFRGLQEPRRRSPYRRQVEEMAAELGSGNKKPDILPKLAQYELARFYFSTGSKHIRATASMSRSQAEVLAGFPDTVRLRTLLRKQPRLRNGYPCILRS